MNKKIQTKTAVKPKKNQVLIIGEMCLDNFMYCTTERFSPEAPVPVLKVVDKVQTFGMAANVYQNLASLTDHKETYINTIYPTNVMLPSKTRYVDMKSNHYFFRVDERDTTERLKFNSTTISSIKKADIIVISDYNKGFLSDSDIAYIRKTNKAAIIFLDTKKRINTTILNAVNYIKINLDEFNRNCPELNGKPHLLKGSKANKIIVTMGIDGAVYKGKHYLQPYSHLTMDVSGAGDTFLAALVSEYINTKSIGESIPFANAMASQVVKERGVSVATKEPNAMKSEQKAQ